jgi:hypothetical protein
MDTEELMRELRRLKRSLEQLEAEFAHGRTDDGLLHEMDTMLENGLADDPRTEALKGMLDHLRENTLTDRPERFADGIRHCRKLKATVEGTMSMLR